MSEANENGTAAARVGGGFQFQALGSPRMAERTPHFCRAIFSLNYLFHNPEEDMECWFFCLISLALLCSALLGLALLFFRDGREATSVTNKQQVLIILVHAVVK